MRFLPYLLALLGALSSYAAPFDEGMECPGGAMPRADILACYNFDAVSNCTTGYEALCASDNPIGNLTYSADRKILQDSPAVGAGYLHWQVPAYGTGGSTSIGHSGKEFSFRYYMRFGPGAGAFSGSIDHAFYIYVGSSSGCRSLGAIIIDQGLFEETINGSTCTNHSAALGWPSFNAGQWHLYEYYGKMETTCSDAGSFTGCNGEFRVYIDGVLSTNKTNFNWCGRADPTPCTFTSFYLPQSYYNSGAPPWGYRKDYDAIVRGNDADTRIEASANALPTTPYFTDATYRYGWSTGLAGFVILPNGVAGCAQAGGCARHLGGDCALRNSIWAEGVEGPTLTGAQTSFDTAMNAYIGNWIGGGNCANGIDGSVKFDVTGTTERVLTGNFGNARRTTPGAGMLYETGFNTYAGASIYVGSTSDLSAAPIFVGFKSQTSYCSGQYCERVGLSIRDGRWAIKRSYSTSVPGSGWNNDTRWYAWRGPKALLDRWHNVEFGLLSTDQWVVWINGKKYGPFTGIISGINPHIGGGTNMEGMAGVSALSSVPVTMWVDNFYTSTVSRQSCSMPGWQSDCALIPSSLGGNLPITGIKTPATPTVTGGP